MPEWGSVATELMSETGHLRPGRASGKSGLVRYAAESCIWNQITEAPAVVDEGAVRMIDTSVVRAHQRGARVASNNNAGSVASSSPDRLGTIQAADRSFTQTLFC
jgi:hypothetical protein